MNSQKNNKKRKKEKKKKTGDWKKRTEIEGKTSRIFWFSHTEIVSQHKRACISEANAKCQMPEHLDKKQCCNIRVCKRPACMTVYGWVSGWLAGKLTGVVWVLRQRQMHYHSMKMIYLICRLHADVFNLKMWKVAGVQNGSFHFTSNGLPILQSNRLWAQLKPRQRMKNRKKISVETGRSWVWGMTISLSKRHTIELMSFVCTIYTVLNGAVMIWLRPNTNRIWTGESVQPVT